MLQLIKVGQYQMYRTVETETRAWVENPLFKIEPNQPVYILARIINADRTNREAHVEAVGDDWKKGEGFGAWFSCPFEKIHTVHDYAPELNQVMRVHGEPK
jgi:hypothetical protein